MDEQHRTVVEELPRPTAAQTEAEARILETLKALSKLASRVAHDINNPLAGIRNSFLLVRDGIPVTHPHHAFIGAIDREINRLATFSRRLHESFDVRSALDARPTIRSAVAEAVMALRPAEPPVAINVDLGSAAYSTAAVPGPLLGLIIRNVVQDLVDNAPPDSSIGIQAALEEDRLLLWIASSGPTRESDAESNGHPYRHGFGPGLAMFSQFAEAMGSQLEVLRPDDGGVEVRLWMPLSCGERINGTTASSPDQGRRGEVPELDT